MERKQEARRWQVLIVEDNPDTRQGLHEWFESQGFQALGAADGETARSQLAKHCPDLICLDLVLPEESGYELCEMIRQSARLRETPVLVMTEQPLPTDRAHALQSGADALLAKPFSYEQLQAQVTALLRLATLRREAPATGEQGAAKASA